MTLYIGGFTRTVRSNLTWVLAASFFMLSSFDVALALDSTANPIADGQKCLEQGDSARALEHFNLAARMNPASVEAHYGRACSLAKLGRTEESNKEFKLTLLLGPSEELAKKCKEKMTVAEPAKRPPMHALTPPATVQAKDVESSIGKILFQSEEHIKAIHRDAEKCANGIYNARTSSLNKALEQDKADAQEEARLMRGRGRRGGFNPFGNAYLQERQQEIQFAYENRMARAKADFQQRRSEAETRAMGIKASAEGLESQMINKPSETSGVYLVPGGTNLYVRNYGHFDPVLPEPPEPLHAIPLKLPQVLKMQEEANKSKESKKKSH